MSNAATSASPHPGSPPPCPYDLPGSPITTTPGVVLPRVRTNPTRRPFKVKWGLSKAERRRDRIAGIVTGIAALTVALIAGAVIKSPLAFLIAMTFIVFVSGAVCGKRVALYSVGTIFAAVFGIYGVFLVLFSIGYIFS